VMPANEACLCTWLQPDCDISAGHHL